MRPVPQAIGTQYGVPGKMWSAGHHTGTDFLAPTGTPVVAATPGRVVEVSGSGSWGSAYGMHVVVESVISGVTYRMIYAHLSKATVSNGATVEAGQQLGLSGATGNVTGPHLHFEVRVAPYRYGNDVDPRVAYEWEPPVTHRFLHANIDQNMSADKIRADVAKLLKFRPTTGTINEASGITRNRFKAAKAYGSVWGRGALDQLGIYWRTDSASLAGSVSEKSTSGLASVSPDRGVLRARLVTGGGTLGIVCTHFVSKAHSDPKATAKTWRRAQWRIERRRLVRRVRKMSKTCDIVIWAGDLNRGTWPNGVLGGALTTKLRGKGYATATIAKTDGTLGKAVYDYVGVVSRTRKVGIDRASTPSLNSDHDAVLVDLSW